jgi:hypothetical protein
MSKVVKSDGPLLGSVCGKRGCGKTRQKDNAKGGR